MPTIDLVCWDFGDTLVDEMFMRIAPQGVPGWPAAYEAASLAKPGYVDDWMLGRATMNDLIPELAARLPLTPFAIASHLRAVWREVAWFDDAQGAIAMVGQVGVAQAIVTVNPHEFHGIAASCGLDRVLPLIVTSAHLATESKPAMADHVRALSGLAPGLATTLLIDNRHDNVTARSKRAGWPCSMSAGRVALGPGRATRPNGLAKQLCD